MNNIMTMEDVAVNIANHPIHFDINFSYLLDDKKDSFVPYAVVTLGEHKGYFVGNRALLIMQLMVAEAGPIRR